MAEAMGAKNSKCIRYMPNDRRDNSPMMRGAFACFMHENKMNAPNVAHSTFGVQNSHDHSRRGVSMRLPGTPCHQNDHAVNAAPATKHSEPIARRLPVLQRRWVRM